MPFARAVAEKTTQREARKSIYYFKSYHYATINKHADFLQNYNTWNTSIFISISNDVHDTGNLCPQQGHWQQVRQ